MLKVFLITLTGFITRNLSDGSLTNIKAAKGSGDGCDEESVRVLKLSPAWKPATGW
jgi:hypothetical protein